MGAGNGPKDQDEDNKDGAGGDGIGQQCQTGDAAGKAVTHDPGSNYGREKKGRAQPLCGKPS